MVLVGAADGLDVVLVIVLVSDVVNVVVAAGITLTEARLDTDADADLEATVVETPPVACTGPPSAGTNKVATIVE